MLNKFIRNFIAKRVAGRTDDGIMITLSDPKKVDFQAAMLEDLLMRNGFNPADITSEKQLLNIINQIEAVSKQTTQSGIRNVESAKVFDLKGKQIKNTDNIMGGEELPPPGSRGGPDDIAAPVQSQEETLRNMTEAEIKKNIEAQNKKGIENILKRKNREDVYGLEDYDTTNMSDIKKQIIRLETRLGNLNPDEAGFKEMADDLINKIGSLQKKLRDDKADGGIMRLGFKDGMNRRTFLKLLGGFASIPIIGKVFKPLKVGKTVTKVPIIKTDNVAGKPEWFDQLVNKVILEGDDVSKRFATKDREIVHMKVLDEGTGGKEFPPGTPGSDDISIMVTQDLDAGAVRVEYRNPENMYGDPVQLRYKKPNPDEGDPRPSAEFDTAESIPVARADGPDDYAIDIDEGGGQSIKDLTSDVSKLKEYATGQKQTLKEFVQSKKRKDKAKAISQGEGEAEQDFIINRQGEEIVEYPEPDFDDAFASGGIARMLGE
jgi:hypothetical protein